MPFLPGNANGGRRKDTAGRERLEAILTERPHINAHQLATEAGVSPSLTRTYLVERKAVEKELDRIPVDEAPDPPPVDDVNQEIFDAVVISEVAAKEEPDPPPSPAEEQHPVVLADIPPLTVRQALIAMTRAVRAANETGTTPETIAMETYRPRSAHAYLSEIFDFLERYNITLEQRIDQGAP